MQIRTLSYLASHPNAFLLPSSMSHRTPFILLRNHWQEKKEQEEQEEEEKQEEKQEEEEKEEEE